MWSPRKAEEFIHAYALDSACDVTDTQHMTERLELRDILMSDVMYVLKYGSISELPQATTRTDCFTCKICGTTLNSSNREICVVVVPNPNRPAIKIITVMWKY